MNVYKTDLQLLAEIADYLKLIIFHMEDKLNNVDSSLARIETKLDDIHISINALNR